MKMFRSFRPGVICGIAALLLSFPLLASTGREHEITDIHFENVTQTTVDVVWTTAHPSTSQVLIARSTDYEPERWAPETADKTLVTSHRVTVDHLVPYNPRNGDGTYYIYVASVDGKGEMSTAPGPATPDGKNPFITMRTRPTDTMGEPKWTFYTMGPNEVFAGHDMYFLIQGILIAGPADDLYVMNQVSPNGETDGVVKSLGRRGGKSGYDRRALSPATGVIPAALTPTIRPSIAAATSATARGKTTTFAISPSACVPSPTRLPANTR